MATGKNMAHAPHFAAHVGGRWWELSFFRLCCSYLHCCFLAELYGIESLISSKDFELLQEFPQAVNMCRSWCILEEYVMHS